MKYEIIGFIPQISQGIFENSDENRFYTNPPYGDLSTGKLAKDVDLSDYPIVEVTKPISFEVIEKLFQRFKEIHLREMQSNSNI